MRYRKSAANRVLTVIFILAAVGGIAAFALCSQLEKHMRELCEYKGRQTANRLISEAIAAQLENEDGDYLNITYDESGKISSLETDTYRVNALENRLRSAVNESLSHIDDNEMSIPLGTMTGITFLSGKGSEVTVELHQTGNVRTQTVSEFSSAGINQTKHSLKLSVTVTLSAVLPSHSTEITLTEEYIIAETIIVGEVPF